MQRRQTPAPRGRFGRRPRPGRSTSERGQTFVEYVTLLALLSVLIVVALGFLGPVLEGVYDDAAQAITAPAAAPEGDGDDEDGEGDGDEEDGEGEED